LAEALRQQSTENWSEGKHVATPFRAWTAIGFYPGFSQKEYIQMRIMQQKQKVRPHDKAVSINLPVSI